VHTLRAHAALWSTGYMKTEQIQFFIAIANLIKFLFFNWKQFVKRDLKDQLCSAHQQTMSQNRISSL